MYVSGDQTSSTKSGHWAWWRLSLAPFVVVSVLTPAGRLISEAALILTEINKSDGHRPGHHVYLGCLVNTRFSTPADVAMLLISLNLAYATRSLHHERAGEVQELDKSYFTAAALPLS